MKLKDIVVGEEYKYTGYNWSDIRAKVLEVSVPLKYRNFPGVLIEFYQDGAIHREAVPARRIVCLWSEVEEERAKQRQLKEESDRKWAGARDLQSELWYRLVSLGIQKPASFTYNVHLSLEIEEAKKLLEILDEVYNM